MKAYDTFIVAFAMMSFVILGWVTVNGSSVYHKSAADLEALLETKVSEALLAGGFDWAAVEMDGQYATLYGTPPNQAAAAGAEEAALTAAGDGGWLRGGITGVITRFEEISPPRELMIGDVTGDQNTAQIKGISALTEVQAEPHTLRATNIMTNQIQGSSFQNGSK